jgi:transmembrane sensor
VPKQLRYKPKLAKRTMTTERDASADISRRAAELAVQFDAGPLSSADLAEADAWLQSDIRHRGAFVRAQAGLIHSRRAAAVATMNGMRHPATGVVPLDDDLFPGAHNQVAKPTRRRFMALAGSAAAISMVGLAAFGLSPIGSAKAYATAIGESRVIQLGEAARMTLNTDSRVLVKTRGRSHYVKLERGEAVFEVVGGRGVRVSVDAGTTISGTTGGTFAVREIDDMPVQLLVQSGQVSFSDGEAQSAKPLQLTSYQRVTSGSAARTPVTHLSQHEIDSALAWRSGMLSFEDQTLADAAREFARYSSIAIEFSDPSVGQQTITGLFDSRDPRGFARSAALSLGMRIQNSSNAVRIER